MLKDKTKYHYLLTTLYSLGFFLIIFMNYVGNTNVWSEIHRIESMVPNYNKETKSIDGVTYDYQEQLDIFNVVSIIENDVNGAVDTLTEPLYSERNNQLFMVIGSSVALLVILAMSLLSESGKKHRYMYIMPILLILILFASILNMNYKVNNYMLNFKNFNYRLSDKILTYDNDKLEVDMDLFREYQLPYVPQFFYFDVKTKTDDLETKYYKVKEIDTDNNKVIYTKSSNDELFEETTGLTDEDLEKMDKEKEETSNK